MSMGLSRRSLLKSSAAEFAASIITSGEANASVGALPVESPSEQLIRLSFNENPYGQSANVAKATVPTAGATAAEPVEQTVGTERNADEQSTHRTLNRDRVSQALRCVRQIDAVRYAR